MKPDFDFAGDPLEPGLSVIEASAGTGKTYAISHLVPRLLLDGSAANLGEILLVTFTNDAARELSERVRRVLEKLYAKPALDEETADAGLHRLRTKFGAKRVEEVAGRALLDLDLLGVSTIHSFCQKVLQTEGTLCGLPTIPELIPDSAEISDRVLRDLWESLIAGNALHAAVASSMGWKVDEDLSFLKTALPLENPEPVPEAGDFESGMAEIENLRGELTKGVCDELGGILESVTNWTEDDPGETVRSRLAARLGGSTDAASQGFLDAVRQAASAPKWVSGSRKEGRALKAKAAECRAVQIAAQIVEILDKARWNFRIGCLAEIRPAVAHALAAARQITYDGLIDTLRNALRGGQAAQLSARLRSRFKVALIDESQDTDDRQFEIFGSIFVGLPGGKPFPDHRLVLIGDPKQAIYAFRGADVNTYLAAKDLAGGRVYPLTKTFRSPAALVRATNALFSRSSSLLKDGLDFSPATSGLAGDRQLILDGDPDKARVECWIVPDADGDNYSNGKKRSDLIAGTVASEIVRILGGNAQITTGKSCPRDIRPGDFAVLVSDGLQAEAVAGALLARDVPAVRAGGDDIMASEEAGELLAILRALHEPRRSGLRLAALATRMLGVSSEAIRALTASGRDEEWMAKLLCWQEAWLRQGIASAIAVMDSEEGITVRLTSLEGGERRVTNLRHLTDLLEGASNVTGRNPGRLVRWLSQEIVRAGERSQVEERQLQIESDAEAVKIVTMHSSKGLQYPLVFCPFLWSSKLPNGIQKLSVKGQPPRLIDTKLADPTAMADLTRANLEDRLRLAYVAITRAQVKVWIYGGEICGSRNRPPASALDWLLRTDAAPDFVSWTEAVAKAGRGTRHVAGLEALADAGDARQVISWMTPPPPSKDRWKQAVGGIDEILEALPTPSLPEPWGLTSFSSLTREKDPHAAPAAGPTAAEEIPPSASGEESLSRPGNSFFDAPGGQLVGTAVHEWIERWDFSSPDPQALAAHFAKFPIPDPNPPFHERVGGMLAALRESMLPGLGCAIREACPDAGASEWHFQLPIFQSLGATDLAAVFEKHGQPDYAAALGALPSEQLRGYLHGFLDRIAFCKGSWGVIDWKTNNLGKTAGAYDPASLMKCAQGSHYLLQAHLYLVALRRFLGPQVPIAGAWLVFLRGVAPGKHDGILHVNPTSELMADLDKLFAQPSR